jgi:hypothetical protein
MRRKSAFARASSFARAMEDKTEVKKEDKLIRAIQSPQSKK